MVDFQAIYSKSDNSSKGDETRTPLIGRCVMRSRTGSRALPTLPVPLPVCLKAGEICFFYKP